VFPTVSLRDPFESLLSPLDLAAAVFALRHLLASGFDFSGLMEKRLSRTVPACIEHGRLSLNAFLYFTCLTTYMCSQPHP
jgi:hypothetical protein